MGKGERMQWAWAREDPAAVHWAGARIWGKEVASCPGFVLWRIPRWGDPTRSPPPPTSPCPLHRCLCPQTPPKHLMSSETPIVLAKLIETGEEFKG